FAELATDDVTLHFINSLAQRFIRNTSFPSPSGKHFCFKYSHFTLNLSIALSALYYYAQNRTQGHYSASCSTSVTSALNKSSAVGSGIGSSMAGVGLLRLVLAGCVKV